MISRIRLRNFQRHADSEFVFSPHVNAILGQSDSGKSAIIRAINWVLTNRPVGTSFIRNGEDECEVEIELQDGTTIRRVRSQSVNAYYLNGEELTGYNRSVPQEVLDALNLHQFAVQFQHDPPFLLSESGGAVARVLNEAIDLEKVDTAFSRLNSEILACNARVRELEVQAEDAEIEAERYKGLETIGEVFEHARKALKKLEYYKRLEEMERDIDEAVRLLDKIEQLKPIVETGVEVEEGLHELERAKEECKELDSVLVRYRKHEAAFTKLSNIAKMAPGLLESAEDKLRKYKETLEAIEVLEETVVELKQEQKRVDVVGAKLEELTEEFRQKMPNVCPLCGQEIRDEIHLNC